MDKDLSLNIMKFEDRYKSDGYGVRLHIFTISDKFINFLITNPFLEVPEDNQMLFLKYPRQSLPRGLYRPEIQILSKVSPTRIILGSKLELGPIDGTTGYPGYIKGINGANTIRGNSANYFFQSPEDRERYTEGLMKALDSLVYIYQKSLGASYTPRGKIMILKPKYIPIRFAPT